LKKKLPARVIKSVRVLCALGLVGGITFFYFRVVNVNSVTVALTLLLAVLAAVIFNALTIIALVPLALRGVKYRPQGAAGMLRRNLWIYGLGGFICPFPFIWLIDRILALLHLA
jgi:high-affinity K+ transport system ATPase subunit B